MQAKFYMILPHLPDSALSGFDYFLLHVMQCVVAFMNKDDKIKCTRIVGMLDKGIPMLNHLGRSKFLKFCSSFLLSFVRDILG